LTIDEFWDLIDRFIDETGGSLRKFAQMLDQYLQQQDAAEIEDFARLYADFQNEANSQPVFEAALITGCAPSDDCFSDFKRWTVLQGRSAFESIVSNPDCLGTYDPRSDPIENWYCEYTPHQAYQAVTGNHLPHYPIKMLPKGCNKEVADEDLIFRYPHLWARCRLLSANRGAPPVESTSVGEWAGPISQDYFCYRFDTSVEPSDDTERRN